MFEQLWFTWTVTGFSHKPGFQVRAASRGLLDQQGDLDMQSARFQRLARVLAYRLPDAANPRELVPKDAPVCLAFQPGAGSLLAHKVMRPSTEKIIYFSHLLLADAPQDTPPDLHARAVIDLWNSPFWATDDQALRAEEQELELVSWEQLTAGPLSMRDLTHCGKEFEFALAALLLAPERRSIYIAGPSRTVAVCIWGITHCLPRTLRLMERLSFSTYEYTLEPTPYRLVGTCWLSAERDFPADWYEKDGEHGWVFNSFTGKRTAFDVPEPLCNYLHFVRACLAEPQGKRMMQLAALLEMAENMKLTEMADFLRLYSALHEAPSRENVEWLLYASQTTPALLSLPNAGRALLHMVEIDPDWWRVQGKSILNNLFRLNAARQQELFPSELARTVVEKLLAALREDDLERMDLWLDMLKVLVSPPGGTLIWVELLKELTALVPTGSSLRGHYAWETRLRFLRIWGTLPELLKNELILAWLALSWNELNQFLSFEMPEEWKITTISIALATPPARFEQASGIVSRFDTLFEKAMQQLLQDQEMRAVALYFFQMLVNHHYQKRFDLLVNLLKANAAHAEVAEGLLQAARLNPAETNNFLEKHLQWMIQARLLALPSYTALVRTYLTHLDVDSLRLPATQSILQVLHQAAKTANDALPRSIQTLLRGWSCVGRLLYDPKKEHIRWYEMSKHLCDLRELIPAVRERLFAQILPTLVAQITSETDLTRIVDSLAVGLLEGKTYAELQVLADMAAIVARTHRAEYPPIRLATYVKVLLGEVRYLDSGAQKEFIERCLTPLLHQQTPKIIKSLNENAALWPPYIHLAWQAYLSGHPHTIQEEDILPGRLRPLPLLPERQKQSVATVGKQDISYEQLRKMYVIKCIYAQYAYAAQRGQDQHGTLFAAYTEQQLRQLCLEDLVNAMIISQEIRRLTTRAGVDSAKFEMQKDLAELKSKFAQFADQHHARLFHNQQIGDADIEFALKIFIQEDLFAKHLHGLVKRRSLEDWLAEHRADYAIVIYPF